MKNKKILCCLTAAFCVFGSAAETITFSAASMKGNTGKSSEYTTLSGSAYIKTDTFEIHADTVQLSGEDYRSISASGNVRGTNTESRFDFTCDRMSYDRQTKIAVLQGTVTMDDAENEVKASAHIIEYDQNTEIAVMQIAVRLEKKENICSSAFAVYRKPQKMLELSGNPQVSRGTDLFRAQEITFNLDTEEITLDGKVSGNVTDTGEKK